MVFSRVGKAICKGTHMGLPQDSWKSICPRYLACPTCETRRAGRRTNNMLERLKMADYRFEDDLVVGCLTVTLPGAKHPSGIRYAGLREQYEYATARTTLPGLTGWHSMRGMNRLLKDLGAEGGTHYLEFTWNRSKQWWNVHMHTLFYGCSELVGSNNIQPLKQTTKYVEVDGEILLQKKNTGRTSTVLKRLGYGPRYTLDYADDEEKLKLLLYSSKVAYATKPFKAPKDKFFETREFMESSPEPRFSRPFGDNAIRLPSLPDGYGEA